MKKFEQAVINVVKFNVEDVITGSGMTGGITGGGNTGEVGGGGAED